MQDKTPHCKNVSEKYGKHICGRRLLSEGHFFADTGQQTEEAQPLLLQQIQNILFSQVTKVSSQFTVIHSCPNLIASCVTFHNDIIDVGLLVLLTTMKYYPNIDFDFDDTRFRSFQS